MPCTTRRSRESRRTARVELGLAAASTVVDPLRAVAAASSCSRRSTRWRSVPAPALRALANGDSPAEREHLVVERVERRRSGSRPRRAPRPARAPGAPPSPSSERGDGRDEAGVVGDVLADPAVAAGGQAPQPPALVDDVDREAVDLQLAQQRAAATRGRARPAPPRPRAPRPMNALSRLSSRCRCSTGSNISDALAARPTGSESRPLTSSGCARLERLELAEEHVVLDVGQRGRVVARSSGGGPPRRARRARATGSPGQRSPRTASSSRRPRPTARTWASTARRAARGRPRPARTTARRAPAAAMASGPWPRRCPRSRTSATVARTSDTGSPSEPARRRSRDGPATRHAPAVEQLADRVVVAAVVQQQVGRDRVEPRAREQARTPAGSAAVHDRRGPGARGRRRRRVAAPPRRSARRPRRSARVRSAWGCNRAAPRAAPARRSTAPRGAPGTRVAARPRGRPRRARALRRGRGRHPDRARRVRRAAARSTAARVHGPHSEADDGPGVSEQRLLPGVEVLAEPGRRAAHLAPGASTNRQPPGVVSTARSALTAREQAAVRPTRSAPGPRAGSSGRCGRPSPSVIAPTTSATASPHRRPRHRADGGRCVERSGSQVAEHPGRLAPRLASRTWAVIAVAVLADIGVVIDLPASLPPWTQLAAVAVGAVGGAAYAARRGFDVVGVAAARGGRGARRAPAARHPAADRHLDRAHRRPLPAHRRRRGGARLLLRGPRRPARARRSSCSTRSRSASSARSAPPRR